MVLQSSQFPILHAGRHRSGSRRMIVRGLMLVIAALVSVESHVLLMAGSSGTVSVMREHANRWRSTQAHSSLASFATVVSVSAGMDPLVPQ